MSRTRNIKHARKLTEEEIEAIRKALQDVGFDAVPAYPDRIIADPGNAELKPERPN